MIDAGERQRLQSGAQGSHARRAAWQPAVRTSA